VAGAVLGVARFAVLLDVVACVGFLASTMRRAPSIVVTLNRWCGPYLLGILTLGETVNVGSVPAGVRECFNALG
jgi:hypothetical protein